MKHQWNLAGPGESPSQMRAVVSSTERLVASEHVQKTQLSEVEKTMLSGTELSVTLKHEELEDPKLDPLTARRSQRGTEEQVLQTITRKFDVSSLRVFPVNQALR